MFDQAGTSEGRFSHVAAQNGFCYIWVWRLFLATSSLSGPHNVETSNQAKPCIPVQNARVNGKFWGF